MLIVVYGLLRNVLELISVHRYYWLQLFFINDLQLSVLVGKWIQHRDIANSVRDKSSVTSHQIMTTFSWKGKGSKHFCLYTPFIFHFSASSQCFKINMLLTIFQGDAIPFVNNHLRLIIKHSSKKHTDMQNTAYLLKPALSHQGSHPH